MEERVLGLLYPILLINANAPVSSALSPAIGDHRLVEPENSNGPRLHRLHLLAQPCLPATLMPNSSAVNHTWVSPQKTKHRIDYIAIPLPWIHTTTEAAPFMIGMCTASLMTIPRSCCSCLPAWITSPHRLADPDARLAFQNALAKNPVPSWQTPPR